MKHKTPIAIRAIQIITGLIFFWINILSVFECYSEGHYKIAALSATVCLIFTVSIIKSAIVFFIEDNSDDYKDLSKFIKTTHEKV